MRKNLYVRNGIIFAVITSMLYLTYSILKGYCVFSHILSVIGGGVIGFLAALFLQLIYFSVCIFKEYIQERKEKN